MLPAIERSAGESFRQIPELAWIADGDDLTVEDYRKLIGQSTCWVALDQQDRPIGFLCAEVVFGELHVWEFAVLQDRQRSGLGRTLMQQAIAEARSRGLAALTLTTFRDVPWNEPFYERLGFKTLVQEEVGSRLDKILNSEIANGLPGQKRCAMRLNIREPSLA